MKRLIILRGLPGSGKTTLAGFLKEEILDCVAYAADDHHIDPVTGEYVFDINNLHRAHEACQNNVEKAMIKETELILVHNTNTTQKELKSYFDLAEMYQYEVTSLIVENRHGSSNVHNVPAETLEKMKGRFDVKLI